MPKVKENLLNKVVAQRYFAKYKNNMTEISQGLDVRYQSVYCWLHGTNSMTFTRFLQFCIFLNLDPAKEVTEIVEQWKKINKNIFEKKERKCKPHQKRKKQKAKK